VIESPTTFEEMLATIDEVSSRYGLAKKNDKVTITGGLPIGSGAPTNFMMIHVVG